MKTGDRFRVFRRKYLGQIQDLWRWGNRPTFSPWRPMGRFDTLEEAVLFVQEDAAAGSDPYQWVIRHGSGNKTVPFQPDPSWKDPRNV